MGTNVTKNTEAPTAFAEGIPVPAPEVGTVETGRAALATAPTRDDYAREWGTYRATTDLRVGRSLAVAAGGPVPASHPYLRDSDERGPGWVTQGMVELVDGGEAPADLRGAHAAAETAKATDGQAYPGAMYPGGAPA